VKRTQLDDPRSCDIQFDNLQLIVHEGNWTCAPTLMNGTGVVSRTLMVKVNGKTFKPIFPIISRDGFILVFK
jgi:hypothetical protein